MHRSTGRAAPSRALREIVRLTAVAVLVGAAGTSATAASAPADVGAQRGAPATWVAPAAAVDPTPTFSEVDTPGPTVVTGALTTDTVWSPQGSPYLITDQVTVNPSVSLTLLPGTVVKLSGAGAKLVGFGQVLSLGTPDKHVTFTSMKDDTIGGDSNGDGDATSPARGDWGEISLGNPYNSTRETFPVSVLDYTDVRWGGASTAYACQTSMVRISDPRNRVILSNSSFTDAQVAAVGTDTVGVNGYQGIYNNHFARSMCGLLVLSAGGDVVGNTFADDFSGPAVQALNPKRFRFWFNTVHDSIGVANGGSAPPTLDDADVSYNELLGGIDGVGTASQQLQVWGPNWWGRDINTEVLPTCVTNAERDAYQPPLRTTVDTSGCTSPAYNRVLGWRYGVVPALSAPPPGLPASLTKPYAPTYGPVDTHRGSLSYAADDVSIEDAGVSVSFKRTYDSSRASGGDVGNGWRSSYSDELSVTGAGSLLTTADGESVAFTADPAAGYVNDRGVAATYQPGASGTTITTPDQTGYDFDADGRLAGMLLGDKGHKLDIDRGGDGKIDKVTGVSDRFLQYHRAAGELTSVSASDGRSVALSHDGSGRLQSVTGVDGKTETYEYAGNRLTKVTSPGGVVLLEAEYDSQGRVSWVKQQGVGRADIEYGDHRATITAADGTKTDQVTDEYGRLVAETVRGRSGSHAVYDGEGRLVARIEGVPNSAMTGYSALASATFFDRKGDPVVEVDPLGRGTVTVFNAKHRPTKVTTPAGGVTQYSYDADGRPDQITDPRGEVWQLTHNGRGQLTTQTDPLGRVETRTYAADGDPLTVTDELGGTTTYETNGRGLVTAVIDPLDHRTEYAYTAWSQVRTVTKPRGGAQSATYDDDRNLHSVTDPTGAQTTYEYDTRGRLSAVVDPEGGRSEIAYDVMGRPTTFTDPRGTAYERTYTAEGWPKTVTGPGNADTAEAVTSTAYDPAGRAVRVTNALGHVTQTVYDRAGQVVRTDLPDGGSTSATYDLDGRVKTEVTPTNGTWTNTWDAAGNLLTRKDPLGATETRTYDKVGRLAARTDVRGTQTTTTYDDTARTVSSTDPLGLVERTTLDLTGRAFKLEDGRGLVRRLTFDADGKVTEVRDGEGGETHYGYDLAGRTVSQTDPRGNTVAATYDDLSRVTKRTYPDLTTELFTYDPAGNLTQRVDRTGATWKATFDAANRVTSRTDPLDKTSTTAYDLLGQATSTTDPTGVTTRSTYDPVGNVTAVIDPVVDAGTTFTYDRSGNVLTRTLPGGVVETNTYDLGDRLTKTVYTGSLAQVSYTYDAAGNTLTRKQSQETFTWEYDARGRTSASIDGLANRTTYDNDLSGNRTGEHLPSGRTNTWTYDQVGRPTSSTVPGGITSTAAYDAAGNLKTVTLPRGGVYSYAYDTDNRLSSQTNPIGKVTAFRYDAEGRPTKTIRPDLTEIRSSYDAAGRLSTRSSTAPGAEERRFGYDAAGRLLKATTHRATGDVDDLVVAYDNRGLATSATDQLGTTAYTYDAARRLTSIDLPNAAPSVFTYNLSNQLATIRGPTNLNVAYDSYGNRTSTTGVSPTTNATQNRTYDKNNRLTSVTYGSGNTLSATYDVDGKTATTTAAVGGTTVVNPAEGTTTYGYDGAGRLTSARLLQGTVTTDSSWEWDADGNRTKATAPGGPTVTTTYDAAGQVTGSSDGAAYAYDDNGQLTGIDRSGSANDLALSYNGFAEVAGQTQGGAATSYRRDALGRVLSATNPASVSTKYGYDAASTDLTGLDSGIPQSLVRDATGTLLARVQGSTTSHAWLNVHGDLAGWRAQTGGAWTSTSLYDAFGNPSRTGADVTGLGFQAMPQDPASGLVDMNARSYNPVTGTFTAEDTVIGDLRSPITLNRYTYGNAAPLDYFDPDGRFGLSDIGNAIGGLVSKGKELGGKLLGKGKRGVEKAINAVTSTTRSVASAVTGAVTGAASAVSHATVAKVRSGVRALQQAGGDIREGFSLVKGDISRQYRSLASSVDTDTVHTVLNIAGFVPGPIGATADLANAGLYFLEGDTKNALISLAATIVPMAVGAEISRGALRVANRRAIRAADGEVSLSGRLVTEDPDLPINLARRVEPEPDHFDVIGHGTEMGVTGLTPEELAAQIRNTASWRGQDVRLLSCRAGCPVSTYAQSLANELGVNVRATNADIFLKNRGPRLPASMRLGDGGSWFTYVPRG